MPGPLDPQTLDETTIMDGTLTSVAVDQIGRPRIMIWIKDEADGATHQMDNPLDTDAVATMGMLQLARDAVVGNLPVRVRYTESGNTKLFHLLRLL